MEHPHARVGQALGDAVAGQGLAPEPEQPVGGGKPQRAPAVANDAVDLRAVHRGQLGRALDHALAQHRHPGAGADPGAFAFHQQRVGGRMWQLAAGDQGAEAALVEQRHAIVAAHPDLTLAAGCNRPQQRVAQPVAARIAARGAVPHPGGARGEGADPQVALAVLHQAARGQAHIAGDPFDHLACAQAHQVIGRADPQVVVAVQQHGLHRGAPQQRIGRIRLPAPGLQDIQPGAGAGPQPVLRALQQVHRRRAGRIGQGQGGALALRVDPLDLTDAADPQRAGLVQQGGGGSFQAGQAGEVIAVDPVHALAGGHQHPALRVVGQGGDLERAGRRRLRIELAEAGLCEHRQPPAGADPQPAIGLG